MNILYRVFSWILFSSIISSILIILVMVFRRVFKNKINPNLLNGLWIIVLIRLLIPINIDSQFNIYNLMSRNIDINRQAPARENYYEEDTNRILNSSPDSSRSQANIGDGYPVVRVNKRFIPIIWLAASSLSLLFIIITINRHKKKLQSMDEVLDGKILNILDKNKSKLNINQDIKILTGSNHKGPYIFGIRSPVIYIPQNIIYDLDSKQINYILLHELYHHKRRDLLINSFQLLALILHWFNPFVWIMNIHMREDRELACDNSLMNDLGEDESIEYGLTLVEVARSNLKLSEKSLVAMYFSLNRKQTKRRINMISKFKKISLRKKVIMLVGIIMLASFVITNGVGLANNLINPKKIEDGIKNRFIIETDSKIFYSLERARNFLDKDVKVPTNLMDGYEFLSSNIYSGDKKPDIFSMSFGNNKGDSFTIESSKSDLKEELLNNRSDREEIELSKRRIGDIEGNLISIRCQDQLSNEYFVWKDGNRNYSFRKNRVIYLDLSKDSSKPILDSNTGYLMDSQETRELINSFTPIDQVNMDDYVSYRNKNTAFIYDETNLIRASKLLKFEPKIIFELNEGFQARSLQVSEKYDERLENDIMVFTTFFLNPNSEDFFHLDQSQNPKIYDGLVENGWTNLFGKKSKTEVKTIKDISVYRSEVQFGPEGQDKLVHYNWKDGDNYFQLEFQDRFNKKFNARDTIEEIINSK